MKFEIVLFPERVRVPLSGILTPRVSDWGYAGQKLESGSFWSLLTPRQVLKPPALNVHVVRPLARND